MWTDVTRRLDRGVRLAVCNLVSLFATRNDNQLNKQDMSITLANTHLGQKDVLREPDGCDDSHTNQARHDGSTQSRCPSTDRHEPTCALEDGSTSESTNHRSEVVASAIQRVHMQLVSGLFSDGVHDRYKSAAISTQYSGRRACFRRSTHASHCNSAYC